MWNGMEWSEKIEDCKLRIFFYSRVSLDEFKFESWENGKKYKKCVEDEEWGR